MRINKTTLLTEIKLGEAQNVPNMVQVLRVGKFNHPQYGFFEITTQTLSEMKKNFDAQVRGVDICFDYYHASDEDASAWVKSLQLRENGTELWAEVDWTARARQKLAERELRYFSPDFAFQWQDPETGISHANVLFGGGLTNRPFVKEMAAIVADEKHKGLEMTELEKAQQALKESEAKAIKLAEDLSAAQKQCADMQPAVSEVDALKKQVADLQAALAKAQQENEAMLAESKKNAEAKMLAEKEKQFNVLLSEGKACAAQKDAFIKGDMDKFIQLSQPMNMKANGSSSSSTTATTEDEKVQKVIALAETKVKENPKLSMGDAISIAKKELA